MKVTIKKIIENQISEQIESKNKSVRVMQIEETVLDKKMSSTYSNWYESKVLIMLDGEYTFRTAKVTTIVFPWGQIDVASCITDSFAMYTLNEMEIQWNEENNLFI